MLRTRLFLNLLPFVVILLAIGLYAIVLFSRLANSVETTVTENYQSIMAAQAMGQALTGMEREAPWISTGKQNSDRTAFFKYQKQFQQNLELQLKKAALPGERELNQQLATNYYTFRLAMATISSLRKPETQRQVHEREVVPSVLMLNVVLEKIRELNHNAILATTDRIRRITNEVTRLMIIGMVIALVISAYACYQLSRSILQPIQLLTTATRQLGEGNLDQAVPVVSRDELAELAVAFNKMAAQLQEYRHSTTERIVRLHRTMETTLASFPDPIFVLNKAGQIELKNPAATELTSSLHLNNALPVRLQQIVSKTLASGENFLPHSFNEGVSFPSASSDKFFLPRILAMRSKDDRLDGVAVVLYDVTRFRLMDAVKTNLVATVSHELKTPLTSVRMALHILLEETLGALNPKQTELVSAARGDAERMLRILNDLLDLTRLEEGDASLRKENTAPADLLKSAVQDLGEQAAAKSIKLTCAVDDDLPTVAVDRQRISHVFANLLSNAIKHSPPNGEVVLRATRANDEAVQFSVTDQGAGIPEEYHTRIFDRFFRVPRQSWSGAGLGLSIAKEITLAHGGQIGVKSAPGQGSTFYVILKSNGS